MGTVLPDLLRRAQEDVGDDGAVGVDPAFSEGPASRVPLGHLLRWVPEEKSAFTHPWQGFGSENESQLFDREGAELEGAGTVFEQARERPTVIGDSFEAFGVGLFPKAATEYWWQSWVAREGQIGFPRDKRSAIGLPAWKRVSDPGVGRVTIQPEREIASAVVKALGAAGVGYISATQLSGAPGPSGASEGGEEAPGTPVLPKAAAPGVEAAVDAAPAPEGQLPLEQGAAGPQVKPLHSIVQLKASLGLSTEQHQTVQGGAPPLPGVVQAFPVAVGVKAPAAVPLPAQTPQPAPGVAGVGQGEGVNAEPLVVGGTKRPLPEGDTSESGDSKLPEPTDIKDITLEQVERVCQ